jgi:hypothetical protein
MIVATRFIFLIFGAAGAQIANGLGLVALLLAAFLGWRRFRVVWLAGLVVVFAGLATFWFARATGSGKISGALSNGVVELIVYTVICVAGYLGGRGLRRLR